jgi:uncharacterized protein YbjT (DUF2867 family)
MIAKLGPARFDKSAVAALKCAAMGMSCAIAGATGLVGGHFVDLALADAGVDSVTVLVRRPLGKTAPKLTEMVVDFDRLECRHAAADTVFCALGTTMKKAGSKEAFRKVDHDYPLALARVALEAGARRFVIVTAVGASARSAVFYNRVKGEVEAALAPMPFPAGVHVLRPSMLLGERGESRPGEAVGAAALRATRFLFAGPFARYRAIEAEAVARAMLAAARRDAPGLHVYEGKALFELAG